MGDSEALADGVSEGAGVAALFFFDDGDFCGVSVGLGVADFCGVAVDCGVGDFSAFGFFFLCFRGAGVGVGAKIFFNVVPT
ncbi:MAG TPA: hypothetical protein VGH00_02425, partial [Chthoniobacterales bacterium]